MMDSLRNMVWGRNHSSADLGAYLVLGIMIGATLYAADYYGGNLIWTNVGLMGLALFLMFGTRRLVGRYGRGKKRRRNKWERRLDEERERQLASRRERECGRCGIMHESRDAMLGHSCSWGVYY